MNHPTTNMWHFAEVGSDGVPRLSFGDGREVRVGETLTVDCEPVVCESGLHACPRLLDALRYAPIRCVLTAVTLGGTVVQGEDGDTDKYSATERTVVAMLSTDDTDKLLREFARWCALEVAHLWDMPNVVRQYLETGDKTIGAAAWAAAEAAARAAAEAAARAAAWAVAEAAARAAAEAAARAAAWAAAEAAARDAAEAAARDAARAAAWAVARAAARDAAGAATRDAAWAAARAAAWDAARDAAGAATWDAARDAQNEQLERMAHHILAEARS